MEELTTKRIRVAEYGINKVDNPVDFNGDFTPEMKNFHLIGGDLRKWSGLTRFPAYSSGTVGYSLSVNQGSSDGRMFFDYTNVRGASYLVAFTDTDAFALALDSGADRWRQITPGVLIDLGIEDWTDVHANITVSHPEGLEVVRMVATSDISGDSAIIAYKNFESKDLTDHTHISFWIKATANITDDLQIVISESANGAKSGSYVTATPMAVGSNTNLRMYCVKATDLSAMNAAVSIGIWNNNASWTSGDRVEIDMITVNTPMVNSKRLISGCTAKDTSMFDTGNALVISNGVEDVYFWDANYNHEYEFPFDTLVHTFPDLTSCVDVESFYEHLMFANYAAGPIYSQSIEFAGAGDVDDHTSISSGNVWLADGSGELLRIVKLGDELICFFENNILIGSYYGAATKFTFRPITGQLGAISSRAVCVANNAVFFIGSNRRFYVYKSRQNFEELGRPVSTNFFLEAGWSTDVNYYAVDYNRLDDRVMFYAVGSHTIIYALNLSGKSPSWEKYEFPDKAAGQDFSIGHFISTSNAYYQHTRQLAIIRNLIITGVLPNTFPARTYRWHGPNDVNTDFLADDTEIECEYQTEDISINDELEFGRFQEFLFTAKSSLAGSSVVVQYSIDNGTTWNSVDESPIYLENNEWKTYRCHLDVVSRVIRFRFTNTAKDLQIKNDMFLRFTLEGVEGVE